MGRLKVKVEKAVFSKNKVRKVQLIFKHGDKKLSSTQLALPKDKDKSKEAVFNEVIEFDVDPNEPLIIELNTSKGTESVELSSVASLKLEKGKEKTFPLDIDEAHVTLYWTAVDFGVDKSAPAPVEKKPKHHTAHVEAAPMPPAEEVERRFAEIARNANLNDAQIKMMGLKEKWSLVLNYQTAVKSEGQEGRAEFWVTKLKSEPSSEVLKSLAFHFGSKGVNWLEEFAQLGGVKQLGIIFDQINRKSNDENDKMKVQMIQALDKLMNNQRGLDVALSTPGMLKQLTLSYSDKALDEESRHLVLKLLTAVCMTPGGHPQVMGGLNAFKDVHKEKTRMETLVKVLKDTPNDNVDLIVAYITFINALANAPSDLDVRVSIRKELEALGFADEVLTRLRKISIDDAPALDQQIEVFDEEREADEKEANNRFKHLDLTLDSIELDNLDWLFTKTKELAKVGKLTPYLRSLLRDLVAIDPNGQDAETRWALLTKLVHQVVFISTWIGDEDSLPKDREGREYLYKLNLRQVLDSVKENEVNELLPLRRQLDEKNEENEQLQKTLKTLEIEKSEMSDAKVQERLSIAADQIAQLRKELSTTEEENKHLHEQVRNFNNQPTPRVAGTDTAGAEIDALSLQLKKLKEDHDEVEKERDELITSYNSALEQKREQATDRKSVV